MNPGVGKGNAYPQKGHGELVKSQFFGTDVSRQEDFVVKADESTEKSGYGEQECTGIEGMSADFQGNTCKYSFF